MTTSLLQNKTFYCREWVFTKLLHCLDSRATAKTCGALVMGGPGSGKTAVCCELVWPTASSRASTLTQHMLAYYFCQAHDAETLLVSNFLRCLADQMMKSPLITGFVANIDADLCHRDPDAAFRDGILTPLMAVPPPSHNLFILVDSVDESYLQSGSRSSSCTIAELLARSHQLCPPWLLVVCTARRQSRSVTRLFAGFRKIALDDLRKAHVVRDVQQYILCRLDRDDKLRLHLSRETAEILNQLHIKCNGCFLYLEKVLDGVVDNFILLREVREIPGTLNGLYLWLCQRLFVGRQFAAVQPVLNVILAARRPLTELELYSCAVTRASSLTFVNFQHQMDVLRKVLVEGQDGTRMLFHHSFAEWLLDVKHCTPRFLCSPSEGHAMLALSFTAHASELLPAEVHDFALHVSRCGLFSQPLHAVLWVAMSGADIEDCIIAAPLPTDPAVVQLLVAAGAKPPADQILWKASSDPPAGTEEQKNSIDETESESHGATIPASPSAGSNVSEPGDASTGCQTALALAARRADLDAVNAILSAGTDVDSVDADGWSALRSAAWGGHLAVVLALLSAGASVDKADADGRTALRAAAWGGHVDVVNLLLKFGANFDLADSEGRTALIAAAYMAHAAVVERLIEAGANVNTADADSRTALAVAALGPVESAENRAKVVSLLIDAGAEVDHRDRDMMTPLLVAAYEGHADVCELLLDAGADVDATDSAGRTTLQAAVISAASSVVALLLFWGAAVDVIDAEGRTVLGVAAQMGDARIVRQLLDRGLDELHRDNAGWTPLHIAAFEGHNEVVEALLEAGARVTEVDNDGRVALILAAQEGHFSVVRTLIETAGTPLESRGHDGRTALRAAAAADNCFDLIRYLVQIGCDVNARDADGRTALYTLSVEGQLEAAAWVLRAGADPMSTDAEGRTALHAAAWHGHCDLAVLLLDHHVDPDACDIEGRTALQSASWQGHSAVVTLLLERGASVDRVCLQGATALCVAAQEGHEGVVRALLSAGADANRADRCGRTPSRLAARGGHVGIIRLLKERTSNTAPCAHNGCGSRPVINGNQTSSSSTESPDPRRMAGVPTAAQNSLSTNQSSSSSGAGGVDSQNLSFTQQLQQCSQVSRAADSGISSTRELSRAAGSRPHDKKLTPCRSSGCGASSDEVVIESVWQRRQHGGSASSARPGAMVMGKTALAMNSPEARSGKRQTNGIVTNPGYSPTTPDVTLAMSSRSAADAALASPDSGDSAKLKAARPSGLALKRETPL